MTTTYSNPTLESQPTNNFKALLVEPFLILGVFTFWIVTLPLVATSMLGIKIWDAVAGLARRFVSPNPLILGRAKGMKENVALPGASSAKRVS